MSFLYAILSSFICGTCLLIIGTANPIHAILLLIRVFFIGTILLFCLQIEYYAMLFLIVYVGAIVVLFLFIIRRLELKRVNVSTRLGDLFAFRHLILLCLILQMFFFLSAQFFDLNGFLLKTNATPPVNINIESTTLLIHGRVFGIILLFLVLLQQNTFMVSWINRVKTSFKSMTSRFNRVRTSFIYKLISFGRLVTVSLSILYFSVSWENTETISTNGFLIEANQYINWSQLIYRTDQLRSLGAILYTEYMTSVILASLLLFISIVGALAVTLFSPKSQFSLEEINSIKRQDANNQAVRNPKFRGINKLVHIMYNF